MKRILGFLVMILIFGVSSNLPPLVRSQEPVNLLQNPGFEGDYFPWSGINEVQVAHGWTPWWRDRTENDPPATYFRPEYKRADANVYDYRVRSGTAAQQWFTFHSTHEAGMYQQVMNVQAGKRYRFTIWSHVWSSTEHDPHQSVNPANPRLQVGIDPTGAWNPWAATVVWSPEYYYIDTWGQLSVETVAQSDVITVFMRSHPNFAVAHNDTYWDDAALINVDDQPPPPPPATATAPPAQPTATPPPTEPTATALPAATATATLPPDVTPSPSPVPTTPAPTVTCAPPPEDWVAYSVQQGDTLFALAESRNTNVDEVMAANCLSSTLIFVGQELLLPPLADEPATVEPTSAEPAPPSVTPPPSATATATPMPATATVSQPPSATAVPATASAQPSPPPSVAASATANGNAEPSPTQAIAAATEIPQATSGATSPPAPSEGSDGSSGLWLGLLGLAVTAGLVGLIVFGWRRWAR